MNILSDDENVTDETDKKFGLGGNHRSKGIL